MELVKGNTPGAAATPASPRASRRGPARPCGWSVPPQHFVNKSGGGIPGRGRGPRPPRSAARPCIRRVSNPPLSTRRPRGGSRSNRFVRAPARRQSPTAGDIRGRLEAARASWRASVRGREFTPPRREGVARGPTFGRPAAWEPSRRARARGARRGRLGAVFDPPTAGAWARACGSARARHLRHLAPRVQRGVELHRGSCGGRPTPQTGGSWKPWTCEGAGGAQLSAVVEHRPDAVLGHAGQVKSTPVRRETSQCGRCGGVTNGGVLGGSRGRVPDYVRPEQVSAGRIRARTRPPRLLDQGASSCPPRCGPCARGSRT